MRPSALLSGIVSSAYYAVWPRVRPGGYVGRLTAAIGRREGLDRQAPEAVWARQQERLNRLLAHVARRVPYYRRLAEAGSLPDRIERGEDLAAVPVMTKEIIRQAGEELLSEDFPREQLHRNATGGSTGQPLHFWSDEPALLLSNAGEAWAASVAGLRRGSSVAYLWGAGRFERAFGKDLRDRLQRLLANQMFINCFRMSGEDLRVAHARLEGFGPEALLGYSSALVELARFLRREGLRPSYPHKAVLSAAETLDDVSRRMLAETFGTHVYDRYGSREIGLIAMECDRHEGLHIDCENVFVELADEPGAWPMRRILVTKLRQFGMPLLRYDIGDLAEGPLSSCSCGRGYPVLKRIVGRVTETIRMPDGGCLPGEIFPHLFKDCGVASYRVEQAADYSLDVALVREPGQNGEQDRRLRKIIADHVGPAVPVTVRYVDRIERSATGKLLPVISHAPPVPVERSGEGP